MRKYNNSITEERLRDVLHYDPQTGVFTWLIRTGPRCVIGAIAGSPNDKGYIQTMIDGVLYKNHRLAFLYMTGEWPIADVDHRDLDVSDNRWESIRSASASQNKANMQRSAANTSGFKGISWKAKNRKWQASIKVNGSRKYLGIFRSKEEAHAAYCAAARIEFGEFARFK